MLNRILTIIVTVTFVWMLLAMAACTESLHSKQLPAKTCDFLEKKFMMSEVLAIVKTKSDLQNVNAYFNANTNRYKYVAEQKQGDMSVQGYVVTDLSLPIIGYSLFFHKMSGSLVIIDASSKSTK